MSRLLIYYAHPGHRHSRSNKAMLAEAMRVSGVTVVDLYAEYPRFDIKIDVEQQRLLDHEVILFQYPMFWYSTPSILKEWQDLVLESGFAYGAQGEKLKGKYLMLAVTVAGSTEAYTDHGYQHYPIRTFLTPLERTARLCHMEFPAPYVLFSSLRAADDGRLAAHIAGYRRLIESIRDDRFDFTDAIRRELLDYDHLPILEEA